MRIASSLSLTVGNVTATVTARTASGQEIASAFTVEVPATVPAASRYAFALYLLTRFIEHTDVIPDVHGVRPETHADYVTYTFN